MDPEASREFRRYIGSLLIELTGPAVRAARAEAEQRVADGKRGASPPTVPSGSALFAPVNLWPLPLLRTLRLDDEALLTCGHPAGHAPPSSRGGGDHECPNPHECPFAGGVRLLHGHLSAARTADASRLLRHPAHPQDAPQPHRSAATHLPPRTVVSLVAAAAAADGAATPPPRVAGALPTRGRLGGTTPTRPGTAASVASVSASVAASPLAASRDAPKPSVHFAPPLPLGGAVHSHAAAPRSASTGGGGAIRRVAAFAADNAAGPSRIWPPVPRPLHGPAALGQRSAHALGVFDAPAEAAVGWERFARQRLEFLNYRLRAYPPPPPSAIHGGAGGGNGGDPAATAAACGVVDAGCGLSALAHAELAVAGAGAAAAAGFSSPLDNPARNGSLLCRLVNHAVALQQHPPLGPASDSSGGGGNSCVGDTSRRWPQPLAVIDRPSYAEAAAAIVRALAALRAIDAPSIDEPGRGHRRSNSDGGDGPIPHRFLHLQVDEVLRGTDGGELWGLLYTITRVLILPAAPPAVPSATVPITAVPTAVPGGENQPPPPWTMGELASLPPTPLLAFRSVAHTGRYTARNMCRLEAAVCCFLHSRNLLWEPASSSSSLAASVLLPGALDAPFMPQQQQLQHSSHSVNKRRSSPLPPPSLYSPFVLPYLANGVLLCDAVAAALGVSPFPGVHRNPRVPSCCYSNIALALAKLRAAQVPVAVAPFFLGDPSAIFQCDRAFVLFLLEDVMRLAFGAPPRRHLPCPSDAPFLPEAPQLQAVYGFVPAPHPVGNAGTTSPLASHVAPALPSDADAFAAQLTEHQRFAPLPHTAVVHGAARGVGVGPPLSSRRIANTHLGWSAGLGGVPNAGQRGGRLRSASPAGRAAANTRRSEQDRARGVHSDPTARNAWGTAEWAPDGWIGDGRAGGDENDDDDARLLGDFVSSRVPATAPTVLRVRANAVSNAAPSSGRSIVPSEERGDDEVSESTTATPPLASHLAYLEHAGEATPEERVRLWRWLVGAIGRRLSSFVAVGPNTGGNLAGLDATTGSSSCYRVDFVFPSLPDHPSGDAVDPRVWAVTDSVFCRSPCLLLCDGVVLAALARALTLQPCPELNSIRAGEARTNAARRRNVRRALEFLRRERKALSHHLTFLDEPLVEGDVRAVICALRLIRNVFPRAQ